MMNIEQQSMRGGAACLALIRRDLTLAFRSPGQIINPMAFFLMVASLFPLGIAPDKDVLSQLAPGIIWIGALLSVLMSLDSLFKSDQDDGSLDQLLMSPHPLAMLVLAKVFSHWLTSGFCLTVMAPLLAVMLHLPGEGIFPLALTLLLGTPVLSLAGAIGAALTVRIQRGGVLLTLLSLPLYIPVLIFATGAVNAAAQGLPWNGHLLWLCVFLLSGLCLAPLAIAGALRVVSE
ncbi:heme exporter protein CcmB [Endozoicomonas ascidiicola]|uniref:heme exporter protein CcmB n=1 Tax=Endozoicomonas ascidiicola TaxID=1698521 RepID=UPI000A641707|nr:heme exporter protein CcmB [Endozoicomonas ascidiicola]